MMDKILFLDMDHTFIRPKDGKTFPDDPMDWEYIQSTRKKILEHHEKGYKIVVVTNQGGIQFGEETENGIRFKFEAIKATMGIPMVFFYCATREEDDPMRKPNIGMAKEAAKLFDIDWKNSIMVGDSSGLPGQYGDSDKKFAENAGIGTYYDVSDFQKLQ